MSILCQYFPPISTILPKNNETNREYNNQTLLSFYHNRQVKPHLKPPKPLTDPHITDPLRWYKPTSRAPPRLRRDLDTQVSNHNQRLLSVASYKKKHIQQHRRSREQVTPLERGGEGREGREDRVDKRVDTT